MTINTLNSETLKKMFLSVADLFQENADYLSQIDSRFGDGDHGITINKIANVIRKDVDSWENKNIKDFIDGLGTNIMGVNGGSAGPLYGTMISGLAEILNEQMEIDAALFKEMLNSSREEMYGITKAREGDKTMMDALIPAVDAAQSAPDSISDILHVAALAAKKGAQLSEGYISKFGRARSYKEQTIGTPDAGAISTALFFEGLEKGYLH